MKKSSQISRQQFLKKLGIFSAAGAKAKKDNIPNQYAHIDQLLAGLLL